MRVAGRAKAVRVRCVRRGQAARMWCRCWAVVCGCRCRGVEEKGDEVVGGEKREMERTGPLVALALQRDGPAVAGKPAMSARLANQKMNLPICC